VSEGRTEREIAQVLSISREQVAEAMARAGIERRTTRRICPVDPVQLTELYRAPGPRFPNWLVGSTWLMPPRSDGWLTLASYPPTPASTRFDWPSSTSTTV
jgi:hypothetical protein